jgi:hypothetical protein
MNFKITEILASFSYKNIYFWLFFSAFFIYFLFNPNELPNEYHFGRLSIFLATIFQALLIALLCPLAGIFWLLILFVGANLKVKFVDEHLIAMAFPLSLVLVVIFYTAIDKSDAINPLDFGISIICDLDSECLRIDD